MKFDRSGFRVAVPLLSIWFRAQVCSSFLI